MDSMVEVARKDLIAVCDDVLDFLRFDSGDHDADHYYCNQCYAKSYDKDCMRETFTHDRGCVVLIAQDIRPRGA